MTKLTTTLVIAIAAVGLSLGGCKKKDKEAPAAGSGSAAGSMGSGSAAGSAAGSMGSGSAAGSMGSGSAAGSAVADPVPAAADSFKVTADHVDAAKGKVEVVFGKLSVKAAKFDPKNLEGGTATVEVDVTSLSSGIADRDAHLQSPDFLDAVKFPVITIGVDNVKKAGDTSYTADANVNAHGIEKKLPVKFEVTGSTADSVTVKVNHTFSRADFSVGGKGAEDPKDPVKTELVLDATLTLKNTP